MTAPVVLVALAVLLWPGRGASGRVGGAAGVEGVPSGVRASRRRPVRLPVSRRRSGDEDDAWVADLAEVVVVGLEAGLDLPRAVLAAARAPTVVDRAPWLEHRVLAALGSGSSVSSCLGEGGDDPTRVRVRGARRRAPGDSTAPGLAVLARAWRLSEEVGAAASTTTAAAAASLRARHADHRRAAALAAGPRASMRLLSSLPLLGPAVGLLVGVGADRLYGSAAAQLSAVSGVALTVLGWAWARALLRRAGRPATTAGPAP